MRDKWTKAMSEMPYLLLDIPLARAAEQLFFLADRLLPHPEFTLAVLNLGQCWIASNQSAPDEHGHCTK